MINIKEALYSHLVSINPNIKAHFEGYKDADPDYHKKHRIQSWKFLFALRKFYINGGMGAFPTAPHSYIPRNVPGFIQEEKEKKVNFTEGKIKNTEEMLKNEEKLNSILQKTTEKDKKSVYLDGEESKRIWRSKPIHFSRKLLRYDVISFDVFDTLIFRPFVNPVDVFMIVGEKLDILDFTKYRVLAEKIARERSKVLNGTIEVSLHDIYRVVEELINVPSEKGAKIELETEKDLCIANPYMKKVFDILKSQNKRIIAVSDMYMEESEIKELLESCGYIGMENVFSSANHYCSKSNKGLYQIVKNKYKEQRIAHIGDNFKSDIQKARECGLEAFYYKNINLCGQGNRAPGMSRLIGSAYSALLNIKYYSGNEENSIYYEIGYTYVGIYVLGYVNWIYNYAKEHKIDKVLFLSRDGDIYYQIFKMIHPDVECEYVYWSRVLSVKCMIEKNWNFFIMHYVEHKSRQNNKSTLGRILDGIGLTELKQYLAEYKLDEDELLTEYNMVCMKRFMNDHKEMIIQSYKKEQVEIKKYLRSVVQNKTKICITDIGWSGSVILPLKEFIIKKCQLNCKVHCLLCAARPMNDTLLETKLLKHEIESYMFSTQMNKALYIGHKSTNKNMNTFLMELLTQSSTPSFIGINNGKFLFDFPEVENYEKNKQIHEGIKGFVRDYTEIFRKYPYMMNIPGDDAYRPFKYMTENLEIFKKYMFDYVFGRSSIETAESQHMETVREIFENNRL